MTKHSVGIYSCAEWYAGHATGWSREDPSICQQAMAALPRMPVTESPTGRAVVETYTVMHRGVEASEILIFGRIAEGKHAGHRFAAQVEASAANVRLAMGDAGGFVGIGGLVTADEGRATFVIDAVPAAKL